MKNFRVFSPFKCFFLALPGLARTLPPPPEAPPPPTPPLEITAEVEPLIFILSPGPAVLEEVEEQFEEVLAGLAGSEEEEDVELEGIRMGGITGAGGGASVVVDPPPPPPPPPEEDERSL